MSKRPWALGYYVGLTRRWAIGSTVPRLVVLSDNARQEKQEARIYPSAGFMLRVSRKRQYADLSYLLPMFPIGPAVKPRCTGPSSRHAIYVYPITDRTIGYAPVGHGYDLSQFVCPGGTIPA